MKGGLSVPKTNEQLIAIITLQHIHFLSIDQHDPERASPAYCLLETAISTGGASPHGFLSQQQY